jgi:hypothetical protein
MRKILFLIFGLILAGCLLVFLAKDQILKIGMEQAVTRLTGFKTHVRALKYDLPSTIRIQDLEILNPPGFEAKVFAKIPEVYISFLTGHYLLGKGVHFREIRLYIQEVQLEKNLKGISNAELLDPQGRRLKRFWLFAERTPFLVERLELSLRRVNYEDHSTAALATGSPEKVSIDLNVRKRIYLNINDPQTLVNLVLFEIVRSASLSDLLGLGPGKLLDAAFSVGQKFTGDQANALSGKAGTVIENSIGGTQDALNKAAAATGKAASGLWGKVKSLMAEEK